MNPDILHRPDDTTIASQYIGDKTSVRIGIGISPNDPYWVQVREAAFQKIRHLGLDLLTLEFNTTAQDYAAREPSSLEDEILAQDLNALVTIELPDPITYRLLNHGLPVIFLSETSIRHTFFTSPVGLYEAAVMAAEYIVRELEGKGQVLCVGGLLDVGNEKGISRINGFFDTLEKYPEISALHCPTPWRYDLAYPVIEKSLREFSRSFDAYFGLSDSLALAARDAGRALDLIDRDTVIVGINGDPLAMAAIADGSMSATVETSAIALGGNAVELAYRAALKEPLPPNYRQQLRLVTPQNVAELALQKLISIADIPSHLVGVNRRQEQNRLIQLETSTAINRHVGSLLDRRQLILKIIELIRANYGYDYVQLLSLIEGESLLVLDEPGSTIESKHIPLGESRLLSEVVNKKEPIFIPDTYNSHRFPPDPEWPETRSRVVLPIRLGDTTLGLLDLHSRRPAQHQGWELVGLQSLADQLGIAIRNAELYSEALHAREVAERANQLKTRLLANVSHELRAPLNVILGYTQSALNIPNPYKSDLPEELLQDLRLIYKSGEHLIRVINDLLDMSRAEIGELDLVIETIDARPFLSEVFNSTSKSMARTAEVEWKLSLPSRLPYIQADPVRLRQILLNLLNNASKFTPSGQIVLGADVEPPYLHIWVEDTGIGVTTEMQERIFEPFGTTGRSTYRREGIGLGLSITRMLVTLHGGSMSLESQAGIGSTFHVYLPLPGLAGPATLNPSKDELPVLLLLSNDDKPPKEIREICQRQGWAIHPLHLGDDPDHILQNIFPVAIAWDIVGASPNEWNLLQRVRSHPQLARMPFILYGLDSETSESVDIGLTNVLLKPIAGSSLLNILDSLRPQTSKFPVLIVDDDPNARALYQRLVVQALPACPVITAEGGAEALAILNQGDPPWLVILDLMMPEVDGFAVLARIRTDPRTHAAPVIVMSGKILTYADVKRLDYYHVVYHTKGVLTNEEAITSLMRSSSDEATLSQPTSVLAKYALAYLHQNYTLPLTRKELAAAVGVSENYLSHIFRLEMGITPWECLNRLRIQKAKELLLNTPETITSVATQVGFDDSGYFSRTFHKITGQSPQAYRKSAS